MSAADLSQASMLDLFRQEAEAQAQILTNGLLALERDGNAPQHLESCMRAAHSLKGAARIVGIEGGVRIAHEMENCFVAAQRGLLSLQPRQIEPLLRALDLLRKLSHSSELELHQIELDAEGEIGQCVNALEQAVAAGEQDLAGQPMSQEAVLTEFSPPSRSESSDVQDRGLRVTAETLNRLLGFAGESLIESRRLRPFADSLLRLKRLQRDMCIRLDDLRDRLARERAADSTLASLRGIRERAQECSQLLGDRFAELETLDRRAVTLSERLYEEALACRMRPFRDGIQAYPRMVRDLARSLHKEVRLVITGAGTQVDRDILERLDAPLGHLLRNAVDHGIESPEERRRAGKAVEGTISLDARQSGGRLHISVRDDGRGIDRDRLRQQIIERALASSETVRNLGDPELFEFLLLPNFTLADTLSEISGRGVGLDVVRDVLKQVRGTVRITSEPGRGTQFQLQLPLTLSVIRALLVEIAGEPYALPLTSIVRTLKLDPAAIGHLEGHPHFEWNGRRIGLVAAHQVLDCERSVAQPGELPIVVLGNDERSYGLLVDRLLGERELVVHLLDQRLGKVQDISAGSLMEDGSPVLILDTDDIIRSVERLVAGDGLRAWAAPSPQQAAPDRKRVLIVEDSLTVRELERKLLANAGYEVEVAVDGMDGWNAIRSSRFDLVITDIDMPRMDGIELVQLIRQDPHVKSISVMIVSYKDRPEDRRRGLDAGADYYLAKSSFHDRSLLDAVVELIGAAAKTASP